MEKGKHSDLSVVGLFGSEVHSPSNLVHSYNEQGVHLTFLVQVSNSRQSFHWFFGVSGVFKNRQRVYRDEGTSGF